VKGYSTKIQQRARRLRKPLTDAELRLWRLLRKRNLKQFKFRRQHPIGPYVADFICLERHLIIEVDGSQHQQQSGYDGERTTELEAAGYQVLRFWDNDVLTRSDSVMQANCNVLDPSPSP